MKYTFSTIDGQSLEDLEVGIRLNELASVDILRLFGVNINDEAVMDTLLHLQYHHKEIDGPYIKIRSVAPVESILGLPLNLYYKTKTPPHSVETIATTEGYVLVRMEDLLGSFIKQVKYLESLGVEYLVLDAEYEMSQYP